jgi:hypothetical protein
VISVVLIVGAPMPDKSTAKIVKWYGDNREAVFVSGALAGLGLPVFLVFLAYLHQSVAAGAGFRRAFLATTLLVSGIVTVAIATVTVLPTIALAIAAGRTGLPAGDGTVHLLADLTNLSGAFISCGLALFLLVLGLLLARGDLTPRWASWVAYIGAAANIIGGVATPFVSKSGKPDPLSVLGLLGLVLFLIVTIAISVDLLRDREPATQSALR